LNQLALWSSKCFKKEIVKKYFRLVWKPKIYYGVHKTPPLESALSQMHQSTVSHPISLRLLSILFFQLLLNPQGGLFTSEFQTIIVY
jgi:hypothetical protein